MAGEIRVISKPTVEVSITSNLSSIVSLRRFQKDISISSLKEKIELLTGASAANMKLTVHDKNDAVICQLTDNNAMLGSFQIDDGCRIHVLDNSRPIGQFEDVSKVQKYEIDPEAYAKREDSVRAFKQRMKLGQFKDGDSDEVKRKQEELNKKEEEEANLAKAISIGNRCEVRFPSQPIKRGVVMHVGKTEFKDGVWVGIQYDEPVGKNDGSVQGKQYFQCPPKYGGFVRPSQVTVGNFPELGLEEDMEM